MFYSARPSVQRLQQHPMNLHVAGYNSHKCYTFVVLMIKVSINVVTCPSKSHNIVIIFWLFFKITSSENVAVPYNTSTTQNMSFQTKHCSISLKLVSIL